jgi:hypothetical protein
MSAGRWYLISDPNIDKLLRYRPSIEEMKVILEPMCYLLRDSNGQIIRTIFDNEKYKSILKEARFNKDDYLWARKKLRQAVDEDAKIDFTLILDP